jgi:hypothetical protein
VLSGVQTPYTVLHGTLRQRVVTHMQIYANSGFNVCQAAGGTCMAADDRDVVNAAAAAAAAYYYLEDECDTCDTKMRVGRPRRFWIHDVISRREVKC